MEHPDPTLALPLGGGPSLLLPGHACRMRNFRNFDLRVDLGCMTGLVALGFALPILQAPIIGSVGFLSF
ncbi:MAG: hypothetical protein WCD16_02395 [Paracoccaceae bacterium]